MDCKLIHLYPDLMSLYGSYANVSVLQRMLEQMGNTVTVERVAPGETADLSDADFLFLGAGTERAVRFAAEQLLPQKDAIHAAVEQGTVLFFAGTGMELLGKTIITADGVSLEGLELADFTTVQGRHRIVGDVLGPCPLLEVPVVGFMNKCSEILGVETPLLTRCDLGFGNQAQGGCEGYCKDSVFGSELTGPLLVKNPRLLDVMIDKIYARHGETAPAERPHSPYAEEGYRITAEQLRLRLEGTK